jgi:serpin B
MRPETNPGKSAVVDGSNAFAVALYGQLRNRPGNLFFSPVSVSIALAMTYAGARGPTAAEMVRTLHFTLPHDRLAPVMGALLCELNAAQSGYQLHVANSLWAQQGYLFLPGFLNVMRNDYGAGFNEVDFKTATEATCEAINRWVELETNNRIQNLIKPGNLSRETRLALVNAIYFKGDWQTPFEKAQTKKEVFHVSAAQATKAPLMHSGGRFNYLDGGTFQALEIPYKSGRGRWIPYKNGELWTPYKSDEISMIVFLPKRVDGLQAMEQAMTASNTKQWMAELRYEPEVVLTLPRFKMIQQFELSSTLAAMGMPLAFDQLAADFTGMTEKREFYISAVIHKAYIEVNEEGTEAAAATVIYERAMGMGRPRPPIVFRADHPFAFLIRDNRSGSILFMGRVTDPTNSEFGIVGG